MGLSVSQVRLLALTTRKADIELQMQVDSKRRQMLTRQSTELSTQYYQRLQDSNIMYATSAGYEDVTYGYLMGDCANGHITSSFYNQILTGADNDIATKPENDMILINKYGKVVVDSDIARAIIKSKFEVPTGTVYDQTTEALKQLMSANQSGNQQVTAITEALKKADNIHDRQTDIDKKSHLATSDDIIKAMIKNGGYQSGGTLYTSGKNDGLYYKTAAAAENAANGVDVASSDRVDPKDGYCYDVENYKGQSIEVGKMFLNGTAQSLNTQNAKYLGALVNYFAPILSAGIQNGISCDYTTKGQMVRTSKETQSFNTAFTNGVNLTELNKTTATSLRRGSTDYTTGGGSFNTNTTNKSEDVVSYAINYLSNQPDGAMVRVTSPKGKVGYFKREVSTGSTTLNVKQITANEYSRNNEITITDTSYYDIANNKEKLQAGFKSGQFQLALVDDMKRGSYKKNTLLNYFTSMNYVVDKTDSSKREELTAWFNAEQSAISEKETYWDSEIQNLSTELTSVNTEIDSVKKLKSDAIKSVFDWGSSS